MELETVGDLRILMRRLADEFTAGAYLCMADPETTSRKIVFGELARRYEITEDEVMEVEADFPLPPDVRANALVIRDWLAGPKT